MHISYSSRTTSCSRIIFLIRFSPGLAVAQEATYLSAMLMDIWIDHTDVTKTYGRQLLPNLQIDTNVAPIRMRTTASTANQISLQHRQLICLSSNIFFGVFDERINDNVVGVIEF